MLYSVKNHPGAHAATPREIHPAEGPAYTVTRVHLVGAMLGFDVPNEDVTPYELTAPAVFGDLIVTLAQEAATIYNLDPKRVQKAADLARNKYNIQPAKRDENGETIPHPSYKKVCVKGSKGWYVVTQGSCTCEDNKRGNVCKHRIAAWMQRETIARPLAAARRVSVKEILAEVMS